MDGVEILVHYAIHFLCKKWTIPGVVLRIQNYHAKKKKKKVIYTRETPSRLYKSSHSLPFRPAYREEPYGYQMSYQHSGSDGS